MSVYVYSSDPGDETLLSHGAVFNVLDEAVLSQSLPSSRKVVGLVGSVPNDRGVPNVAVELGGGLADLENVWGGFSPYLGAGEESGYEGNLYARSWGIVAPHPPAFVLQPVDLAVKDDTIGTGVDLLAKLTRSDAANGAKVVRAGTRLQAPALSGTGATGAESTDVLTSTGHGLTVGRVVIFGSISGGAGMTAGLAYTVATVPSVDTFTLNDSNGDPVDFTTDITDASWTSAAYVVATLEDVVFTATETGTKSVRVRQVSGTPCSLAEVDTFVDASPDTNITVATTETGVPEDVDEAELIARYEYAINHVLDTQAGRSVRVITSDQDLIDVSLALDAHAVLATSRGYWRFATTSPPVGTTGSEAEGASWAANSSFDGTRTAMTHPAWTRGFRLDKANLSAPHYTASIPAAISLAARIGWTVDGDNPARDHQCLRSYKPTGTEPLATPVDEETHFTAHLVVPTFEQVGGRQRASFRDGICLDGSKIADRMMRDFLEMGAVEVLRPYHKGPATDENEEAAGEALVTWLDYLKDETKQIGNFAVTLYFDPSNDHLRVSCAVNKRGNYDTITFALQFGGNAVADAGGQEA